MPVDRSTPQPHQQSSAQQTPPEPIAAVMVCEHGSCGRGGPDVVDALRPLVARTPRAVLLRTGCLHDPGHGGGCPDHEKHPGCWVRLQRCTDDLRPVGVSWAAHGTTREAYRRVESWLDSDRS